MTPLSSLPMIFNTTKKMFFGSIFAFISLLLPFIAFADPDEENAGDVSISSDEEPAPEAEIIEGEELEEEITDDAQGESPTAEAPSTTEETEPDTGDEIIDEEAVPNSEPEYQIIEPVAEVVQKDESGDELTPEQEKFEETEWNGEMIMTDLKSKVEITEEEMMRIERNDPEPRDESIVEQKMMGPEIESKALESGDGEQGYENDYKYTGKELDEFTDLYYYEARYYNPEIGRFISQDPWFGDLTDPQSLNKYSYVRNNPIIGIDPSGLLTIFVHGTWSSGSTAFSYGYMSLVTADLGDDKFYRFNWSGENSIEERSNAALELSDYIRNYEFEEGEELNIVAHSHGGNVAIESINSGRMLRDVDNLILLATPNREDYDLELDNVGNVFNIYHEDDIVMWAGAEIADKSLDPNWTPKQPNREGENVSNLRFTQNLESYEEKKAIHSWIRTLEAWKSIRVYIREKLQENNRSQNNNAS